MPSRRLAMVLGVYYGKKKMQANKQSLLQAI
jgi:hypothetical protein